MKKYIFLFILFLTCSYSNAVCLSGTYTIGGTSPDYSSFSSAISSLVTNGVCGPVVFNVRNGTYSEQITIPDITGTSGINTITFQSENGDSASVILTFPSSSSSTNNFVVFLNGGDYIHFENMTISRTGALNYAIVIDIKNNSDSLVFRKNYFKSNTTAGAFAKLINAIDINGLDIIANKFERGTSGLYLDLYIGVSPFVVDSNIFINQGNSAIYVSPSNSFMIRHNTISNSPYGITFGGGGGNSQIIANKMTNISLAGLKVTTYNTSGTYVLLIANNFIHSTGGGVELNNTNNVKFLFNSIYTTGITFSPYHQDKGNNIVIFNNIFYSVSTSPAIKFTNSMGNPNFISNNNLFYSNGVNLVSNYTNVLYPTLSLWTAATGNDASSFNSSVTFVAPPYDLHVPYSAELFGHGFWNAAVPSDIDGDARNPYPCIGADEFPLPVSNASISSIDTSSIKCGGLHPVLVKIHNGGQLDLTSAVINWSVDNLMQTPYNWAGFLLSNNSNSGINIGSYNFSVNTTHIIKVWPSNLNTGTDSYPENDTLTYTFITNAMSGIYTVGGSSPDFATLSLAASNLLSRGVCGSVIFNIRPGTYSFGVSFPSVAGASDINTITFQSENSDSTSVDINNGTPGIVVLDGGSYFTFKHLFINGNVIIKNFACYNSFIGCQIVSSAIYNTDPIISVIGGGCNYNSYIGNNILGNGQQTALKSVAPSYLIPNRGTKIKNNYIKLTWGNSWTLRGVLISHEVNDTISNNILNNAGADILSDSSTFNNNSVFNRMATFEGKDLKVFNNFINFLAPTSTYYWGVKISGRNTWFVHNTVSGWAPPSGSTYPMVYILDSSYVRNNIFSSTSVGVIFDCGLPSGYNSINSNWNDFYSPLNTNYIYWQGSAYTLAGYKTASGNEMNSINQNPHFVSATNLHVYNPGGGISSMPSYPFCTDDIDGDMRISATPKAGADEFATLTGTFDAAMNELVMSTNICYGNQPIKLKIYNNENSITLTYAIIKWEINGINQPNYTWSGVVPIHDTSTVFTIGNYFFNGGINSIKVWISTPNGFSDPNGANDTLTRSSFVNSPVQIGNDTTLCEGNSMTLDAGNFVSYLWSNGSVSQTINANVAGNYSVVVIDSNSCSSSDSIHITIPIANFRNDTSICVNDTIMLNAGTDFISYMWSTGSTTQTINALPGNVYWVTGYANNSCISKDTITIGSHPLPTVHLGNDTTICANASLTLSPGSYSSYNWTGGSTGSTYSDFGGRFGIPNIIWVTVKNSFGCSNSDSINVYAKQVNATITCNSSGATLNAGPGYYLYNWIGDNAGLISTTQTVTVTTPDIYTINAMDLAGCEAISEYNVNSFSPVSSFTFTHTGLIFNYVCPSNGLTYLWDFGDGFTSSLQNPSHTYLVSGNYMVKLTVSNACGSNLSNQTVSVINAGIFDQTNYVETKVSIFPNPNNGIFKILASNNKVSGIVVYNLIGEKIFEPNNLTSEIDLSNQPNGIYFINIKTEKGGVSKKIIINR
ncbi:MAG: hypothetical protein A3F72_01915 [Bacteroidetes bacterium RIFCSPLOWO2_12_FULL_35_15]|nr:MAG: hypothetical protein A3F72_01915 [Bacteroidetes bacterium RIFCSPLOWO2_12_FULL_35_15]